MMDHMRHKLKATPLAVVVASPATLTTVSAATTAGWCQQAYCSYMRLTTANMEAGNMGDVKQTSRNASGVKKSCLSFGGRVALDTGGCLGVNLVAAYEPEPSPEIDEKLQIARQRVAKAKGRSAKPDAKRKRERENSRKIGNVRRNVAPAWANKERESNEKTV